MKLIGLDVGTKRIGVAKADTSVRIAVPVGFVEVNQGREFSEIARVVRMTGAEVIVVGMPRNVKGEETAQSDYVRGFVRQLRQVVPSCKIRFQDETLTSIEAEKRLKARKKAYQKGDIDAESAVIILQDCIEYLTSQATQKTSDQEEQRGTEPSAEAATKPKKKHLPLRIFLCVFSVILLACAGAFLYYRISLGAVNNIACADGDETAQPTACDYVGFAIAEGETSESIASRLEQQGLIRSSLAFRIYAHLQGSASQFKIGEYQLRETMTTPEISAALVAGPVDTTFSFTILPGENIFDVQSKLLQLGYPEADITAAFAKDYRTESPELAELLASKPVDASLEGYLYGETYEFYKGEKVENILIRAMTELAKVVKENNLTAAYSAQNLTLHQGITLASIVQAESTATDYANVAQVFLSRLGEGMNLGSDITVQYALDLIDPSRTTYDNNADALSIDSPYNTRKYPGLPPTPVNNPGLPALLGVARPAETDYLYFLTGDDGVMYYSYTEDEHLQKVSEHCQNLCNVAL